MRTAIYVRLSQDKTGQMAGVQRQEDECRALAERHGWEIDQVYVDNDISATTGKTRPGFEDLLRDAPGRVVVWHTDRLARLGPDLERVIKAEMSVHAVHAGHLDLSNATGRMQARLATTIATYEGEHKAERQRAANLQRAQQGIARWSRRPYGFEREGDEVTVVPQEARVIQQAAKDVLAGATLGRVVRDLNAAGERTTLGNPWTVVAIKRVLTNPRIAGMLTYRGEVFATDHPTILDPDTFEVVRTRLTHPSRRTSPASTRAKYLLSGLAVCGRCGSRMYATTNARGSLVLRCQECTLTRLYEPTEAYVRDVIIERLSRDDLGDLLVDVEEQEDLVGQIAVLRDRLHDLAGLVETGDLPVGAVRESSARIRAALEPLERRLAARTGGSPLADLAGAPDPAQAFLDAPLDKQRRALAMLTTVTVLPVGKGTRWTPQGIHLGAASTSL